MKISKKWITIPVLVMSVPLTAQKADNIVEKYFDAIGGMNQWKSMTSMRVTGTSPTPQGNLHFVINRKAPNKIKFVIDAFGTEIVSQAFDGKNGWNLNPMTGSSKAKLLSEEETQDISLREFEPALIDYKEKGHTLTFEGEEEIDGLQCYKLILVENKNNDKDDFTTTYYFSKETYLLVLIREVVRWGPSKGIEIESHLSDYQSVSGFSVPYFTERKVGGRSVAKFITNNVEINIQLEDAIFAYPSN